MAKTHRQHKHTNRRPEDPVENIRPLPHALDPKAPHLGRQTRQDSPHSLQCQGSKSLQKRNPVDGQEHGAGRRDGWRTEHVVPDLVLAGGGVSEGRQQGKGHGRQRKAESSPDVWSPGLARETRKGSGRRGSGGSVV